MRATPHGFFKIRDEDDGVTKAPHSPTRTRVPGVGSPAVDEEMWKMGESYGENTVCVVTLCVGAADQDVKIKIPRRGGGLQTLLQQGHACMPAYRKNIFSTLFV